MDQLNYRVLSDGRIAFPARGDPPKKVTGFRVTNDPYIFEPDLEPCVHREFRRRVKPCGKIDYPMVCGRTNEIITFKTCDECVLEDLCTPPS